MTDNQKTWTVIGGLLALAFVLPLAAYVSTNRPKDPPAATLVAPATVDAAPRLAVAAAGPILPDTQSVTLARQRNMRCASKCADAACVNACRTKLERGQ